MVGEEVECRDDALCAPVCTLADTIVAKWTRPDILIIDKSSERINLLYIFYIVHKLFIICP